MEVLIGSRITNEALAACPPGSIFLAKDSGVGVNTLHRGTGGWIQTFYDDEDKVVYHSDELRSTPAIYTPENRLVLFLP